jgi:hypothetical protein
MAFKRIIAYYMDDDEHAAAEAIMRDAVSTGSFVIGEID